MSSNLPWNYPNALDEVRDARGWMIGLGIALSILGIIMFGSAVVTTLLTIGVIGFLLLVGGIVMVAHAFWIRKWSGMLMSLLTGIFLIVSGVYIMTNPLISLAALTLLLAVYFITTGVLKCVFSMVSRFHNWGWMFFSGLLSIVLGALIWSQWPASSLFIFGLFLGIDLLFIGVTWTVIGLTIGNIGKQRPAF